MQIVNTADRLLTLQQRRHQEAVAAYNRVRDQREEIIAKLVRLDARLQEAKRTMVRTGKRLTETQEAFKEAAPPVPPPAPVKPPKVKTKELPPQGDPIVELTAAAKAAKMRDEMRGERLRKRN